MHARAFRLDHLVSLMEDGTVLSDEVLKKNIAFVADVMEIHISSQVNGCT